MRGLVDKWVWWRHAWFFNWAHKPLCEPYREDVLRLGQLRLCRGCSALWFGALITGPLLLALSPRPLWSAIFAALFMTSAALSHPSLHSKWPRAVRDALRVATGCLPTLAVGMLARGHPLVGAGALTLLAGTYLLYRQLRKPRGLHKCESCPESGQGICSGYAVQAQAIRVWEEEASQREMARRMSRGH